MTGDVETVRPLELLHRVARELDAVVVLCSTSDARNSYGKRANTRTVGARITRLAVVRPHPDRDLGRWQRLQRGELVAVTALVDPGQTLDWYANVALLQIRTRLRRPA